MISSQARLLERCLTDRAADCEPLPSPLTLAYLGDAVFALHVRGNLIAAGKNKVRVLHGVSSYMVSAVAQAQALEVLLPELKPPEREMIRRGRNTKSAVPKSASVRQYRLSTGLECLLGWLYWQGDTERLNIILTRVFFIMLENLQKSGQAEYES